MSPTINVVIEPISLVKILAEKFKVTLTLSEVLCGIQFDLSYFLENIMYVKLNSHDKDVSKSLKTSQF